MRAAPALLAGLLLLAACASPLPVRAWGPHSAITEAAVRVLGPEDPLLRRLGPASRRLRDHCWMADWKRSLMRDEDGDYYADDYLLFPGMPRHPGHLCPEVRQTYAPHFRRALQALRTESPVNAARWIGSLLHFTEDSGSPPHAAEIGGPVHSRMENWIDARGIEIAGYRPRLLGRTDETALEGFLERMEGLIAFSKPRGLRLRPLVEAGDRAAVEPLVLECALATARVDADLLHTLGHLAGLPGTPDTRITGKVRFTAPPGLEQLPAKVVVEGTAFSTLAAADGTFELRGLPPGRHRLSFMAPGGEIRSRTVRVGASPVSLGVTLPASPPGNLLRNPAFRQRWVDAEAPHAWYRSGGEWEGELVPVEPGGTYRLSARWRPRAAGEILLRWWDGPSPGLHRRSDAGTLAAGVPERIFTAPAAATFAQVVVRSTGPPNKVCRDLAFARTGSLGSVRRRVGGAGAVRT